MEKPVILLIIEWILFAAVNALVLSYVISFLKKNYERKFYNKNLVIVIFVTLESSLIPLVLSTLSQFVLNLSNALNIAILVLAFAILLIVCGIIFFMLQYIAIGITDDNIEFLGERIPLKKIFNLSIGPKGDKYYVHYFEGHRRQKKYSFLIKSLAFDFMKENEEFVKSKALAMQEIENESNNENKTTEKKDDEIKSNDSKIDKNTDKINETKK